MSGAEGPVEGADTEATTGGDATGGGSPGDQDAMGADEELTVEQGSGRTDPNAPIDARTGDEPTETQTEDER